ncbi:MAG TPA: Re/Si-specific NAD(P)(+) transhydrogenase subunit alpha [Planctomycetota bacterium]|nr:Re/Si-specific NAD(P)(+) transhydrogenase subunit alpha [Planctomycetota bacterium]
MVVIFVPKETADGETRVAAVPETVKGLTKLGLQVQVERAAGTAAGFPDADYETAGAALVDAAQRRSADIVLGIQVPSGEQASSQKAGSVLICTLTPGTNLEVVKALRDAKVTAMGMEFMPRITRSQKMDVLSSQSTCSGYQAVLLAAVHLPKMFPLMMTAAGTLTPARVLVLGAGVAGLQAISTARKLGAIVEGNDIRPAVKEQVESLGAKFVDTGAPPDAETKGGYAKETTQEFLQKQREILTRHIGQADVLITTALVPGKKAPVLVTAEMRRAMKPGSVIVDMAAGQGGNVEGTKPGERAVVDGVTIIGDTNLAAQVASDASRMYARNVLGFLGEFVKDGAVNLNFDNEILAAVTIVHDGVIRHEPTGQALAAMGS